MPGGIVVLEHSCAQCDPQQKVALYFGGHDTIYRPWCSIGIVPMLGEDESPRGASYLSYELVKYSSARCGPIASTYLQCKMTLAGKVDIDADKDCYVITLSKVDAQRHAGPAS
jgi:hypothetical protein